MKGLKSMKLSEKGLIKGTIFDVFLSMEFVFGAIWLNQTKN
jgi:hypothetical protein